MEEMCSRIKKKLPFVPGYLITVQRELNKPADKLNSAVSFAFCKRCKFVTKELVIHVQREMPGEITADLLERFELDTTKLSSLPVSSSARAGITTKSHHLLDNRGTISAHRLLKKRMHGSAKREKPVCQKSTKQALSNNPYANFTKENYSKIKEANPDLTFLEIMRKLSEIWAGRRTSDIT